MSTVDQVGPARESGLRRDWRGGVRRVAHLAWAEGIVLRRSSFALATAIGAPFLLVMVQMQNSASLDDPDARFARGTLVITSAVCLALIFSLYATLVAALVARRESLVLKRLRSGELRDGEIIAGTAVPGLVLSAGQISCALVAALVVWTLPLPTNAVLVVVATVLGCTTFVALATVTAAGTRTVELAQLTAVPLMMVSLVCSGFMFPVESLPAYLVPAANVLPLTSVVDLLGLGLAGRTRTGEAVGLWASFAEGARPLAVLLAWSIASAWGARRWFRWEPRR